MSTHQSKDTTPAFSVLNVVFALVWFVLAGYWASRGSENPIYWVVALACVVLSVVFLLRKLRRHRARQR